MRSRALSTRPSTRRSDLPPCTHPGHGGVGAPTHLPPRCQVRPGPFQSRRREIGEVLRMDPDGQRDIDGEMGKSSGDEVGDGVGIGLDLTPDDLLGDCHGERLHVLREIVQPGGPGTFDPLQCGLERRQCLRDPPRLGSATDLDSLMISAFVGQILCARPSSTGCRHLGSAARWRVGMRGAHRVTTGRVGHVRVPFARHHGSSPHSIR